jgi:hypothetical protein
MGSIRDFNREQLIVALLSAAGTKESGAEARLFSELRTLFGPIENSGPEIPFDWTDYYEAEMGTALRRGFLVFDRLVDPSTFAAIKVATNRLEESFSLDGRRSFNLDPGLLSPGRFILATTKDRAHRIPLQDGIYAELTLQYENGEFRAMPWTYPDWRSDIYRGILADFRARLKAKLKREAGSLA